MDFVATLDAAELSDGAHRFALWLFSQYGGSGVCWVPRARLASTWRCAEESVRRYCEELEKAPGGLLRRVSVPGTRQKVILLFTSDASGVRRPMGKLGDPLHEHAIGKGWSSQQLLALAAKGRVNPTPVWGSDGSTPHPCGVQGAQPHTRVGLTTPEAHTRVGLNPTPVWGPIKNSSEPNKQQQHEPSLTQVTGAAEAEAAAPAAAAGAFDFDRGHREALRRLGLSETDPLVGQVLGAVAVPGATRQVLAQRFTVALAWAETQRSGGGALRSAVDRGYLGVRVDGQLAPKPEAELGIHDAPVAGDAAAGVPWDRDLEDLILKLHSPDHWHVRMAERRLAAEFAGDRGRALEAHAEQVALVPEGAEPVTWHAGGITWWRAWVDELRAAQAAGTDEGAERREVACG